MASKKGFEPRPVEFVPSRVFFATGVGVHKIQRVAVQRAMEEAGVSDLNIVKVTSVIPPKCEVITAARGLKLLQPGAVVFGVIAQGETNEPHQRVTAAVCWAKPEGDDIPGYMTEIEEEQTKGKSEATAAKEAGEALVNILADKVGVKVNAERIWSNRGSKRWIRVGNRRARIGSVVASSVGAEQQDGENKYTVVLALAIFV